MCDRDREQERYQKLTQELGIAGAQVSQYAEANKASTLDYGGPAREHSSTIVLKRARGLRDESALYFWLSSAIERDPPSKEVEVELYNLLTRGYVPKAY